jgi:protein SCO1/2
MSAETTDLTTGRPTRHRTHWLLPAVLLPTLLIITFMAVKPLRVMPRLAPAPGYTLADQHGEPVSAADLRGKVVLYDFIYTSCTTMCPAMTAQMLKVQRGLEEKGWLGDEVMLVSITFDPERDTPARMAEKAREVNANPDGWLWLTGDLLTIKQLVGGEFGVYFEQIPLDEDAVDAAGLSPEQIAEGYDFVHATAFVLVDEEGTIRADYRQMLDAERALRDIALVVREKNAGALAPLWGAAHAIRAYP